MATHYTADSTYPPVKDYGRFSIQHPYVLNVAPGKMNVAIQHGRLFEADVHGRLPLEIEIGQVGSLARSHAVDNNCYSALVRSQALLDVQKQREALERAHEEALERHEKKVLAALADAEKQREEEAWQAQQQAGGVYAPPVPQFRAPVLPEFHAPVYNEQERMNTLLAQADLGNEEIEVLPEEEDIEESPSIPFHRKKKQR